MICWKCRKCNGFVIKSLMKCRFHSDKGEKQLPWKARLEAGRQGCLAGGRQNKQKRDTSSLYIYQHHQFPDDHHHHNDKDIHHDHQVSYLLGSMAEHQQNIGLYGSFTTLSAVLGWVPSSWFSFSSSSWSWSCSCSYLSSCSSSSWCSDCLHKPYLLQWVCPCFRCKGHFEEQVWFEQCCW